MATTLEIIRGISQAVANSNYDGADAEIGLQREIGDPILDKRIMDGFSVSYYGDTLCLHYHTEITLKELHALKDLENEIDSRMNKIVKFLKKEYKKVTGDTLSLTEDGEVHARAEYMSRIRSWVTAKKLYKIGGISGVDPVKAESEERLDKAVKNWLSLGKQK